MSSTAPKEVFPRQLAIGLLLFALAAVVRLFRLDQGLWSDEINAVVQFFRAPWMTLVTSMPNPNHHPLYSLLGKLAILTLGEKEWTVRLPAMIAGAASVPALYFFGDRRVSRPAALTASLILVFSMWPVWFSQDARGYSLMALLTILSNYYFLEVRDRRGPAPAAAYVFFTAAAVYTHAYAVMVPAAQFLVGLALPRGRDRRPLLLTLAAFFAIGILYAPFARDALLFVRTEGADTSGRALNAGFLLTLVAGWAAGDDRLLWGLPFFLLAALGLGEGIRRRPVLTALLVLPVALGILFALLTGTFVYQRFFLFGLPGFLLFVGSGCDRFGRLFNHPRTVTAATVVLLLLLCLPALHQYFTLGKQGIRTSARWIAANAPGVPVRTVGMADIVYSYYCPQARSLDQSELNPQDLQGSIVAVVHPWSVGKHRLQALNFFCGQPRLFPAAGYRENLVMLFDCRHPASTGPAAAGPADGTFGAPPAATGPDTH